MPSADDTTHCDPRRLFQTFLLPSRSPILPPDLLKALYAQLPLLRDFQVEELELWIERGNGPACAHLGVRHMWGICGVTHVSWLEARKNFAIGCELGSIECFGLEAIMECFGYGNPTGGRNAERAKELANVTVDMGLWANVLADRTDACLAYIASVFVGMGLVTPPNMLSWVTIHKSSVQNAHAFFDMLQVRRDEDGAIIVHWQGADYLGMYNAVQLCSSVVGIQIGIILRSRFTQPECHAISVCLLQYLGE
jgi:hypothetical protein